MTQKTIPIIIVLLAICITGAFVMVFVTGDPRPLSSHQAIIDGLTIKTTGHDLTHQNVELLTPTFLYSDTAEWLLATYPFQHDGTYAFSVYVYSYERDPEVFATVWGVGDDGKSFRVELANEGSRLFHVDGWGVCQDFQNGLVITVIP